MSIPFFNPGSRSTLFILLLLLAFMLLVFTGLGVFRLYFDFQWGSAVVNDGASGNQAAPAATQGSGQYFSLGVRAGKAFNFFTSRPLGSVFWTTQALTLCMVVLMPLLRPIGAAIVAALVAGGIFTINYLHADAVPSIPLEFELLTVFVLFCLYILMSYFAEVRDRAKFRSLLSQYVPPELATEYSRNPDSMGMEGEAREVSVLFCDVIGFSSISEKMDPRQTAMWLNAFFSRVSKVVVRHRGTIDKYIGDSVMAFWGAPASSDTHAFDALSAAHDITMEIRQLSDEFEDRGLPALKVGVGVSTGMVNVGNLGSEHRMAYTVVGDTVNVAQRLEKQTRRYDVPVVVSGATAETLPNMLFRELDTVPVKGRTGLVKMYQPLGSKADADGYLLEQLDLHRQAMLASKNSQWDVARKLFAQLREDWGPVAMYDLYLHGIDHVSGSAGSDSAAGQSEKYRPGNV